MHRLDADVTGSDLTRFLGSAVRVAKPGGRGTGHRVAAPVERLVERRRPGRQQPVGVEPHVHGPKVVIELDARARRLLALQVHELGGLDRGQGHPKIGHGHGVPGHPARWERRLIAGRRRVRYHRRYQRPSDNVSRLRLDHVLLLLLHVRSIGGHHAVRAAQNAVGLVVRQPVQVELRKFRYLFQNVHVRAAQRRCPGLRPALVVPLMQVAAVIPVTAAALLLSVRGPATPGPPDHDG